MDKIIPTYVYTEMTPNPASMKFVADRMLIKQGEMVEYNSPEEVKFAANFVRQLFNFPFVESVFVMSNFITINKTDIVGWDEVKEELRTFIQKELMTNELAVEGGFDTNNTAKKSKVSELDLQSVPSEFDDKIQEILKEYVRPAVEKDGGAIDFISYIDGKVTVSLKGSCSGCPSATVTLKNGVESLLQSMIPQITEVVALEM